MTGSLLQWTQRSNTRPGHILAMGVWLEHVLLFLITSLYLMRSQLPEKAPKKITVTVEFD